MADPVEIEVPLVVPPTARRGPTKPPLAGKQAVSLKPLTHNQRHNRYERARYVRQIRDTVRLLTRSTMTRDRIEQQPHITVQLHYRPGHSHRRRDAPNLTATSKPAIDGIVDAGLVVDDSDGYVTEVMPVIHPEPGTRRLWLAIHLDTQEQ